VAGGRSAILPQHALPAAVPLLMTTDPSQKSLICSRGDRFTTPMAALLSSRPFTIQVIRLMTGVMPSLL